MSARKRLAVTSERWASLFWAETDAGPLLRGSALLFLRILRGSRSWSTQLVYSVVRMGCFTGGVDSSGENGTLQIPLIPYPYPPTALRQSLIPNMTIDSDLEILPTRTGVQVDRWLPAQTGQCLNSCSILGFLGVMQFTIDSSWQALQSRKVTLISPSHRVEWFSEP